MITTTHQQVRPAGEQHMFNNISDFVFFPKDIDIDAVIDNRGD